MEGKERVIKSEKKYPLARARATVRMHPVTGNLEALR